MTVPRLNYQPVKQIASSTVQARELRDQLKEIMKKGATFEEFLEDS